jgi:hypothetical protein
MLSEIQVLEMQPIKALNGLTRKRMTMKRYIFLVILFLSLFAGRAAGQACVLVSGSADQSVCDGIAIDPIQYSVTGATEVSTITLPAGLTYSFTAPVVTIQGTPTATGDYSVTLSDGTSDLCTSTGTITVNPIVTASVTIAASDNPVCAGTSVTFTATPVNGGTPTYQWYLNSGPVGSDSPTYNCTPDNGDQVYVVMTSDVVCVTGSPATSNTVTMTVNTVVTASVTIAASDNPVCAGTSVTFTATPVNGGTTPIYQWYLNSGPVGSNSPTYNCTPDDGDQVYVVMTSDVVCVTGSPATSNTITMTVNPLLPVSVSIVASDNYICTGTAVTYTATPVNGGSSPSYQWYKGATPVGTNSYTYTYNPANNDVITVRLTSSETCKTGSPATSNPITMTVYSSSPNQPGSISGSSYVCEGQSTVDYSINDVTNAQYYEWTTGTGYTLVSGQGTTDIVVDYALGATSHNIYVNAQNACGTSSNKSKSITVKTLPTATIDVDGLSETTVCRNAASPHVIFHNPQAPTDIVVTYNINGTNQTTIDVTTSSATINAPTTTAGTFTYTLVSVKYRTGTECSNFITGTATVNVTPTVGTPTPITISAGSDPACQLTNGTTTTTYTTTATNSTSFNWSLSTGSAGSINASSGVMTWANGFSGSVDIRVTANGCNGPSPQVTRTVNVTPTVGTPTAITISGGTEPTCQLTNGTTTTTYSTSATNSTGFNWSLSNSAAGSIDPVTGVMTWANGFSGSVNIQVTANGCNGPSSQVIRAVNITPAVGNPTSITVSAGSEPVCQLTNGTTTTTYATTATNSTGFNWSISNLSAGSIIPATGVMTWANGFSGSVDIQVYAIGCTGNSPQVIRTVYITPTVGTPTPITIFAGSDPTCQLTSGTTMTIYSTTATNSTGFNWSVSDGAAGSINSTSGLMTWTNGFSGNVDIRVTANGCNGPSPQVIRTVTVNPLPVVTITGPATPRITSSGNIYQTQVGMSGYTWSVSGGGSGSSTTNTISVTWNTTGSQTVSVNYIDTHGCTAISPTIYNVVVKPITVATNAQISGYPAVGNTLTGTYTYTDGSSGTDNSTFRWLRNGTDPIALATSTTYVPTMDDVNKTLTFEVTPVSSVGPPTTGLTITSSPTELVEDLTGVPVADEVCIEGIRDEGNVLRGEYRYTFSKAEGVSTYRWLRRDTATGIDVVIGTGRQDTLVTEDIDDTKDIIFEVTPVSSNLTPIAGTPVQSRPLARILLPKTEYSVSESDVVLLANEPGGVFSGTGVTGDIFSPSSAGSAGSPYTLTYLLNIVNTSSSCSQQASKIVVVNPNVTSFVGVDPFYCHDGGPDVITVSGVPSDATERDFALTDSDAIIGETSTSVTIDPGKMRPGVNQDILYFSYKRLGIFYRISKSLVIDSVGTDIRIINLDNAYCEGDERKYISVEGVYPAGGTAEWSGVILSDTKPASAFADPSLGIPDSIYPISYRYKTPIGCYSKVLRDTVAIHPLPDPSFPLNATYNIAGGAVDLIPVQSGGTFSGSGVSGEKMFPDIAGLGEHEIKYTIIDANGCSADLGKKTTIRQAQGTFSGIPSVICYSDTTYMVSITGLPAGITVNSFTNTKNSLVDTLGLTYADYSVPAAGEGYDTLRFSYNLNSVDYSISKALLVDSLGQVVIKNLTPGDLICDNMSPYELFPSKTGGTFTGPVSGSYLDPTKVLGPAVVSYTYTNLNTGCSISTSIPVIIYPAPKVTFAPKDVCVEDETDSTYFKNNTTTVDTVEKWLWEFTDITGIKQDSLHKDAWYLYKTGGLHKIALTATTVNGCSATKESTFNFGVRPDADFYWRNDCMHPGDYLILRDTTESSTPLESRSWLFNGTEFSKAEKEASYPKDSLGIGYYKFQYIVRTTIQNCIDTVTKDIYIKPSIIVPDEGYHEDFEAGNGSWIKGETSGTSWSFGLPDWDNVDIPSSVGISWFTDFSSDSIESSSIVSPCFDFTVTERPLIELDMIKRLTRDRDGASLQYRIGSKKNWQTIGALDDGINWYNSAVIRGEPGGSQMGWTTRGEPDDTLVKSIHTLDELKGLSDVVFRIAYGFDGTSRDYEGIILDNVWIGERSRNILIEHFTNLSSEKSEDVNMIVNEIVDKRSDDVINIQYHTNFPGSDQYYDENPADVGSRILFYGLTQAPYTFVDGGIQSDFAYMYSYANLSTQIDSNDVTKRSLIPSLFDISLTTNIYDGILTINGKITALKAISSDNLTLFIAVTEKKSSRYIGPSGETESRNVFRKFIPDAGGVLLKSSWAKDESLAMAEQTWSIDLLEDTADIEVIAFIQNTITKEVYQAASVLHHDIVVGIEDTPDISGSGFTLYPNPAVNKLTIRFKEPLAREADIRIYDVRGVIISSYKAGSGITEFLIDDLELKGGIYLVRITEGVINLGFRKLVVRGD